MRPDRSTPRTDADPVPARAGQRVLSPVIVQLTLQIASGYHKRCGTELFLAFGVLPPNPEWGAMSAARAYIWKYPLPKRVARHVDRNGRSVAESV